MSDNQFTKIAVGLLTGVKDLVDWGLEGGHTTEEQLKLTVSARQEKARELQDAGLSVRQIASALGTSKSTIHDDLSKNRTKDVRDLDMEDFDPPPERSKAEIIRHRNDDARRAEVPDARFETIVIDPPWPMTKIERDVRPTE
jgi:hypothetical protein